MVNSKKVKKIISLLSIFDEYRYSKLAYKNKKFGIIISDKNPKTSRPVHSVAVERVAAIESPIKIENTTTLTEAVAPQINTNHQVKSPLTGAFYQRPKPGSPPFVKEGDIVEPQTTLCLLEAMKMFNEVKAGVRGKVVEIFFSDGDFVGEGDVLVEIEPL